MNPYKVFLRLEAMESLKGIRGSQKGRISRFLDSLASDPSQTGDYAEQDDTQRRIEIKVSMTGERSHTSASDPYSPARLVPKQ